MRGGRRCDAEIQPTDNFPLGVILPRVSQGSLTWMVERPSDNSSHAHPRPASFWSDRVWKGMSKERKDPSFLAKTTNTDPSAPAAAVGTLSQVLMHGRYTRCAQGAKHMDFIQPFGCEQNVE